MEIFVPGRLCILGEHTDWAGGYREVNGAISYGMAIVCTTNEGLYARCQEYQAGYLRYQCGEGNDAKILECNIFSDELMSIAKEGSFFSYITGTMAAIIAKESWADLLRNTGINIVNYKTTLPMKKGLSSSAAVCVLVVQSFSALFNVHLELSEVMELAYLGEMNTPSRCGRMDQCVCMGQNSIGLMEFNGSRCVLHRLFNPIPLHFVVADLKSSKDTVVILRELNSCFPQPSSIQEYAMHRYSHENQDLAWKAVLAIFSGDLQGLGESMNEAQRLFNDCAICNCPSELIAPILNRTINDTNLRQFHIAAKGVGSQGDGSIQFLCNSTEQQSQLLSTLINEPWNFDAFALTIAPSQTQAQCRDRFTKLLSSLTLDRIVTALIICEGILSHENENSLRDVRLSDFLLELIACGVRDIKLLCLGNCDGTCERLQSVADSEHQWSYSTALRQNLSKYLSFYVYSKDEFFQNSGAVLPHILNANGGSDGKNSSIIFGSVRHLSNGSLSSSPPPPSSIFDLLVPSREPKQLSYQDGLQISAQFCKFPRSEIEINELFLKICEMSENRDLKTSSDES